MSRMRGMAVRSAAAIVVLAGVVPAHADVRPTADDLVVKASAYVERFVQALTNVVSEERYEQVVKRRSGEPDLVRTLRSDFHLVQPAGSAEWFQFRDVIEVDGQRVSDRDHRLQDLMLAPQGSGGSDRAQRLSEESARYNLGFLGRSVNMPLVALGFLQDPDRDRFAFMLDKPDQAAGSGGSVIAFKETARPTIDSSAQAT